jgi:hypothetical protein
MGPGLVGRNACASAMRQPGTSEGLPIIGAKIMGKRIIEIKMKEIQMDSAGKKSVK